jgi:hypothetical protein
MLFLNKTATLNWLRRDYIFIGLGLMLLVAFSTWNNLNNLTLRNAVGGFTPLEYVDRVTYPENYANNFENGVLTLNTSLLFHFYEAAYKANISPERFQRFVIVLSVILFAGVLWYFSSVILPNAPPLVHLLTVMFGLATDVLNHDLARFGNFAELHMGQMYAPAAICAVFAITCAFRRSWVGCFIAIGLAFCFHPIMGILGGLICGAMLLTALDQLKEANTWIGGIAGFLMAGAWYVFVIQPSLTSYEVMDTGAWVAWARFGSFHWFPFSLEVFGSEHARRVSPLLAIFILALTRLVEPPFPSTCRRMWYAAVLCAVVLTCLGLLASLHPISPTIIKLALHRASMFILLLSLPLALHLLINDLKSGNNINRLLALVLLITPVVGGAPGFPLLYAALRFGTELWQSTHKRSLPVYLGVAVTLFALFLCVYLIYSLNVKWADAAFVSRLSVFIFAAIIASTLVVFKWMNKDVAGQVIVVLGVLFCLIFSLYNLAVSAFPQTLRSLSQADRARDSAYLDVQLWANQNTPPDTLFMIDPAGTYGWRDYSQRPSFGVLREWIHTSWLYTGNKENFNEGMRRVQILGINPYEYLQRSLGGARKSGGYEYEYRRLVRDVRTQYNSLKPADFVKLAQQEKIDFFVFEKKQLNQAPSRVFYENKYYVVCGSLRQKN